MTAATTRREQTRLLHAHHVKFGRVLDPMAALAGAGRRATRLFPELTLASALERWATEVLAQDATDTAAEPVEPAAAPSTGLTIDRAIATCDCVVCGAPEAPSRPQLPLESMSKVCDQCWPAIAAELADARDTDERMLT